MDDDLNAKFAEIFVELHALRLIVNEALSVVLSYDDDPDNAVVFARKEINEMIERAETMATAGPNAEFRKWHLSLISPPALIVEHFNGPLALGVPHLIMTAEAQAALHNRDDRWRAVLVQVSSSVRQLPPAACPAPPVYQNSLAKVCKTVYSGSIPDVASTL
jgi:hypothetical protein